MNILDALKSSDESGTPIYKTYWAIGLYDKDTKDRPWLEIVVDQDNKTAYPVSHQKPDKHEAWKFFYVNSKHKDFGITNFEVDSWIDVTTTYTFPEGTRFRRKGFVWHDLSKEFTKWRDDNPHAVRFGKNPMRGGLIQADEYVIAPWLYGDDKLPPRSLFEIASFDAYQQSKVVSGEAVFCYDAKSNRIVAPSKMSINGLFWWSLAFTEYIWENLLDDDIKIKWARLAMSPKNEDAVEYLFGSYLDHASSCKVKRKDELTMGAALRGSISIATAWMLADPREVHSAQVIKFVEANCLPYFLTRE